MTKAYKTKNIKIYIRNYLFSKYIKTFILLNKVFLFF